MAASVEDLDIISDLSSILEQGISSNNRYFFIVCFIRLNPIISYFVFLFLHRHEKDSSNDEDMFADSSGEGSRTALEFLAFDEALSDVMPAEVANAVTLPLEASIADPIPSVATANMPNDELNLEASNKKPEQSVMIPLPKKSDTLQNDEDCLHNMTGEEEVFFRNYVQSENCYLIFNFSLGWFCFSRLTRMIHVLYLTCRQLL